MGRSARCLAFRLRLFAVLVPVLVADANVMALGDDVRGRRALHARGAAGGGNILLLILDDVGIDQLRSFRSEDDPNVDDLAQTPTLDAIGHAGVRFVNAWAMPDCSPSRSALFTGRFPMRTGVMNACLPEDLPISQVSPYEVTLPEILSGAEYEQHYVGKWHLGDPSLNPAGPALTFAAGFPSFDGTPYGGPAFIDATLGNQLATDAEGRYSCGFPIDERTASASRCACAFPIEDSERCEDVRPWIDASDDFDALDCLAQGGVPMVDPAGEPILEGSCEAWNRITFSTSIDDGAYWNGYYVMPRVEVTSPDPVESVQRGYATSLDVDRAIDWYQNGRDATRPWFLTVGFESIHTPYQQAPNDLRTPGPDWPEGLPQVCGTQDGVSSSELEGALRELTRQMLEGIDLEVRRLLENTGLASFDGDEIVAIDPDTTIIMLGDNGTYYPSVNAPYNFARAKATAYQTGVSVPVSIAGREVDSPGRTVDAMINIVDLFVLMGELAGVEVTEKVPPTHVIDGLPMLDYLRSPDAPAIRDYNFAQLGQNIHPVGVTFGPCVLSAGPIYICTDGIFYSENLCEAEGGEWYGGAYSTCSELEPVFDEPGVFKVLPEAQQAITDGRWKLVQSVVSSGGGRRIELEFFDLLACEGAEYLLSGLGVDNSPCSLDLDDLDPVQTVRFLELFEAMQTQLNSEIPCPGDGNLDKKVDAGDIGGLLHYWGSASSVYDLNRDTVTDGADLGLLLLYWNPDCAQ